MARCSSRGALVICPHPRLKIIGPPNYSQRVPLLLVLVLVLAFPALARAETVTQTADSGPTHAELSFDRTGTADAPQYSNMQVRISEDGVETVSDDIGDGFAPGRFGAEPSIRAVNLDGDKHAEVLVDYFTGGAHCCLRSHLYDGQQRHDR